MVIHLACVHNTNKSVCFLFFSFLSEKRIFVVFVEFLLLLCWFGDGGEEVGGGHHWGYVYCFRVFLHIDTALHTADGRVARVLRRVFQEHYTLKLFTFDLPEGGLE